MQETNNLNDEDTEDNEEVTSIFSMPYCNEESFKRLMTLGDSYLTSNRCMTLHLTDATSSVRSIIPLNSHITPDGIADKFCHAAADSVSDYRNCDQLSRSQENVQKADIRIQSHDNKYAYSKLVQEHAVRRQLPKNRYFELKLNEELAVHWSAGFSRFWPDNLNLLEKYMIKRTSQNNSDRLPQNLTCQLPKLSSSISSSINSYLDNAAELTNQVGEVYSKLGQNVLASCSVMQALLVRDNQSSGSTTVSYTGLDLTDNVTRVYDNACAPNFNKNATVFHPSLSSRIAGPSENNRALTMKNHGIFTQASHSSGITIQPLLKDSQSSSNTRTMNTKVDNPIGIVDSRFSQHRLTINNIETAIQSTSAKDQNTGNPKYLHSSENFLPSSAPPDTLQSYCQDYKYCECLKENCPNLHRMPDSDGLDGQRILQKTICSSAKNCTSSHNVKGAVNSDNLSCKFMGMGHTSEETDTKSNSHISHITKNLRSVSSLGVRNSPCLDPFKNNRCPKVLKGTRCKNMKCQLYHVLPKHDRIYCPYFLYSPRSCKYDSNKCIYLHEYLSENSQLHPSRYKSRASDMISRLDSSNYVIQRDCKSSIAAVAVKHYDRDSPCKSKSTGEIISVKEEQYPKERRVDLNNPGITTSENISVQPPYSLESSNESKPCKSKSGEISLNHRTDKNNKKPIMATAIASGVMKPLKDVCAVKNTSRGQSNFLHSSTGTVARKESTGHQAVPDLVFSSPTNCFNTKCKSKDFPDGNKISLTSQSGRRNSKICDDMSTAYHIKSNNKNGQGILTQSKYQDYCSVDKDSKSQDVDEENTNKLLSGVGNILGKVNSTYEVSSSNTDPQSASVQSSHICKTEYRGQLNNIKPNVILSQPQNLFSLKNKTRLTKKCEKSEQDAAAPSSLKKVQSYTKGKGIHHRRSSSVICKNGKSEEKVLHRNIKKFQIPKLASDDVTVPQAASSPLVKVSQDAFSPLRSSSSSSGKGALQVKKTAGEAKKLSYNCSTGKFSSKNKQLPCKNSLKLICEHNSKNSGKNVEKIRGSSSENEIAASPTNIKRFIKSDVNLQHKKYKHNEENSRIVNLFGSFKKRRKAAVVDNSEDVVSAKQCKVSRNIKQREASTFAATNVDNFKLTSSKCKIRLKDGDTVSLSPLKAKLGQKEMDKCQLYSLPRFNKENSEKYIPPQHTSSIQVPKGSLKILEKLLKGPAVTLSSVQSKSEKSRDQKTAQNNKVLSGDCSYIKRISLSSPEQLLEKDVEKLQSSNNSEGDIGKKFCKKRKIGSDFTVDGNDRELSVGKTKISKNLSASTRKTSKKVKNIFAHECDLGKNSATNTISKNFHAEKIVKKEALETKHSCYKATEDKNIDISKLKRYSKGHLREVESYIEKTDDSEMPSSTKKTELKPSSLVSKMELSEITESKNGNASLNKDNPSKGSGELSASEFEKSKTLAGEEIMVTLYSPKTGKVHSSDMIKSDTKKYKKSKIADTSNSIKCVDKKEAIQKSEMPSSAKSVELIPSSISKIKLSELTVLKSGNDNEALNEHSNKGSGELRTSNFEMSKIVTSRAILVGSQKRKTSNVTSQNVRESDAKMYKKLKITDTVNSLKCVNEKDDAQKSKMPSSATKVELRPSFIKTEPSEMKLKSENGNFSFDKENFSSIGTGELSADNFEKSEILAGVDISERSYTRKICKVRLANMIESSDAKMYKKLKMANSADTTNSLHYVDKTDASSLDSYPSNGNDSISKAGISNKLKFINPVINPGIHNGTSITNVSVVEMGSNRVNTEFAQDKDMDNIKMNSSDTGSIDVKMKLCGNTKDKTSGSLSQDKDLTASWPNDCTIESGSTCVGSVINVVQNLIPSHKENTNILNNKDTVTAVAGARTACIRDKCSETGSSISESNCTKRSEQSIPVITKITAESKHNYPNGSKKKSTDSAECKLNACSQTPELTIQTDVRLRDTEGCDSNCEEQIFSIPVKKEIDVESASSVVNGEVLRDVKALPDINKDSQPLQEKSRANDTERSEDIDTDFQLSIGQILLQKYSKNYDGGNVFRAFEELGKSYDITDFEKNDDDDTEILDRNIRRLIVMIVCRQHNMNYSDNSTVEALQLCSSLQDFVSLTQQFIMPIL